MDVNGRNVHPGRSMGALPPVAVHQLVDDPVGMRSRSAPKGGEKGETRPFSRSLRNGIGCEAGQSRATGDLQHLTAGEAWVRAITVIFSHTRFLCVAVWAVVEPRLYRGAIAVASRRVTLYA